MKIHQLDRLANLTSSNGCSLTQRGLVESKSSFTQDSLSIPSGPKNLVPNITQPRKVIRFYKDGSMVKAGLKPVPLQLYFVFAAFFMALLVQKKSGKFEKLLGRN